MRETNSESGLAVLNPDGVANKRYTKLRREDKRHDAYGEMAMFIRIQKTQKESNHPLSPEMLALCGERDKGIVFTLKKWLKAAGITKRITFQRFRDTFASLQLAAGTDIYTVSKMLDHANVTTTQIYARLVDSTKRDTVGRIKLT